MTDMLTYIRSLNPEELTEFLYKGGFCPEKACDEATDTDTKPFFGAEKAETSQNELCEAGIGSHLCRECIRTFLEEECENEN